MCVTVCVVGVCARAYFARWQRWRLAVHRQRQHLRPGHARVKQLTLGTLHAAYRAQTRQRLARLSQVPALERQPRRCQERHVRHLLCCLVNTHCLVNAHCHCTFPVPRGIGKFVLSSTVPAPLACTTISVLTTSPIFYAICMRNCV